MHRFDSKPCASCHQGDEATSDQTAAHQGLIASPGELENASVSCGDCHRGHVDTVLASPMHTGHGMVRATREALQKHKKTPHRPASLQALGHDLADGLLRKQCASCHLGQTRRVDASIDPLAARGGGCLACHLKTGAAHPRLDIHIGDERCLGCHSRSGRISLAYAGLAEVDSGTATRNPAGIARLGDGRLVRQQPADAHHRAGLACIDCHTGPGLMGFLAHDGGNSSIDIACTDCHDNRNPRARLNGKQGATSPGDQQPPYAHEPEHAFLTTANGTVLWHIQLDGDQAYLHPKHGGQAVRIPHAGEDHVPLLESHERLSCDACHAQWVPRCLGCHLEYDPDSEQWDHLEQRVTPGRWKEKRWDTDAGEPVLGMRDQETIDTFVPGMILTATHPSLEEPLFLRRFTRLSPHTTGKARGCDSCHRSSSLLGLGSGKLEWKGEALHFTPSVRKLQDGLPMDAWTCLDDDCNASSGQAYPGPLKASQIERILRVSTDLTAPARSGQARKKETPRHSDE